MPTGDDAQTAQAYYDYLTAHALAAQASTAPHTQIDWTGPLQILFFAALLIVFFMLYSLYFQQRTRRNDELYGVVSFGGKILERAGSIPLFERVVWGAVVLYALYVAVSDILVGQLY
jgi:hypothetical protein